MKIAVCPLYDCCVNQKQQQHCGLCSEFPCAIFNELRDPSLSDEEADEALHARQRELVRRKEIGTENWLREQAAGRQSVSWQDWDTLVTMILTEATLQFSQIERVAI